MRQRGDGARFLLETHVRILVCREAWREDLERDLAAESRIAGAVDFAL